MTRRRLAWRLAVAATLLAAGPALVVALGVVAFRRLGALADPAEVLPAALAALALAGCVAAVAYALGRAIARRATALRDGTELMASVHPGHRHQVGTGDELEALAAEINRLADQLEDARAGLDARVAAATRELEHERRLLAAILADLAEGVVVATLDGRITLANRVARELLAGGQPLLGRDLFAVLPRDELERVRARLAPAPEAPERFAVRLPGGEAAQCGMTPLLDAESRAIGFVVALRAPGGEAAAPADAPGRAAGAPAALRGAGLSSGVAAGEPAPPTPEEYDFTLLEQTAASLPPASLDTRVSSLTFVVLDTETTGLDARAGHRVVSIAGVRVRAGAVRPAEAFDALVHPGRAVPADSTRIHGITDAMVAGAPPIDVVLPAFLEFAGDSALAGHEVSFDLAFLAPEVARLGRPPLAERRLVVDTRLLSRALHPDAGAHGLEVVAARLGVGIRARHSALGDALATAEVLVKLLALLERRGIGTVGELLALLRRARPAA